MASRNQAVRHKFRQLRQPVQPSAKPLSTTIERRLEFAKHVYNLAIVPPVGGYTPTLRNTMFHALNDLVQEHFGAIIRLVEAKQFFGSSLALLRPLIETFLRSVWALNVATDGELAAIGGNEKDFPKFGECRKAAEDFFAKQGAPGLFAMQKQFVSKLHGFTHSGHEQIVHRFDELLQITPYEYPDALIMDLLEGASMFATMAAIVATQAVEGSSGRVSGLTAKFIALQKAYAVPQKPESH